MGLPQPISAPTDSPTHLIEDIVLPIFRIENAALTIDQIVNR